MPDRMFFVLAPLFIALWVLGLYVGSLTLAMTGCWGGVIVCAIHRFRRFDKDE